MWERIWRQLISRKSNPLNWLPLCVLAIGALLYRLGNAVHIIFIKPDAKLKARVISVGGITVGGSGKTPMVEYLAVWLKERGKTLGIVCGGYGRKENIAVEGCGREMASMSWEKIGDETKMLAESLPGAFFAVGLSKSEAARRLDEKYRPDIILIDDAFQHRRLHRDLDLVLIDSGVNFSKEFLFPLGRLREGRKALTRADLVVLTKSNLGEFTEDNRSWLSKKFPGVPATRAEYLNEDIISKDNTRPIEDLTGRSVYFFAGLADGRPLKKHLENSFACLAGFHLFPDHCRYEKSDLAIISEDISRVRPEIALTTNKDYVKIRHFNFGVPVYYLGLEVRLNETESDEFLKALGRIVENG